MRRPDTESKLRNREKRSTGGRVASVSRGCPRGVSVTRGKKNVAAARPKHLPTYLPGGKKPSPSTERWARARSLPPSARERRAWSSVFD